jgi:group I intron endonuclease
MTQVIYKIINLVNDKFYVGSTTNKKVRFREHRKQLRGNRHHCKHLQAAWNKYGEAKFDFVVVEEVPPEHSLHGAEDRYLKQHFGKPYCYNSGAAAVAPWRGVYGAAHPNFGHPVTEEQKQAISKTLKDFYAADYFNHPRVGKTHSEATRAKISESKKANPTRYWQAKERSEATKQKIGDTQRGKAKAEGRRVSEAGMQKIRAAVDAGHYSHWKGRKHTDEARQKMSKRVISIDPAGVSKEYPSLTAVLTELELKMPTLARALKSGNVLVFGPRKGWSFRYA